MEDIRLSTVDGFDIAAVLTRADPRDVVLWMHGITVNKDEYLGFFRDGAQWLASQGITSIRFDFRGHGQSSGSSLDFSIVGHENQLAQIPVAGVGNLLVVLLHELNRAPSVVDV